MIFFQRKHFSRKEEEQIKKAIVRAESETTGEIRVLLKENITGEDIVAYARKMFFLAGMHKTQHRNALLIIIVFRQRKAAVWGDDGIHQKVGQNFWNQQIQELIKGFKEGKGVDALCKVIENCGEELKKHFPLDNKDNPNELSDEVIHD